VKDCSFAEMDKGDGLILLSSLYHGGGSNTTLDEHRLMFSTFVVRGHLRQEENQYLAIPKEIVRNYDRETQKFIGYAINQPACGNVEEMDPMYTLYPEKYKDMKPGDARLRED
jgi:ectoine hydroxylase-related dioxygenase (phytanoyl-CoA dioxygenase family)